MKSSFCGLLILVMVSACVKPAGLDKKLTYGTVPTGTEAIIMSYLKNTLKDPDSMKNFAIQEPRKGSIWGGIYNGFKREPRWYVCFTYNAKNSYGAYTGQKEYVMWFRHGKPSPLPGSQIAVNETRNPNPHHVFYC